MKKILTWIKENKWILFASILVLGILTYTTMNTTLASDDYPYSLFYRGEQRITSLYQVIANQVSDYLHINGRIFTNGLGQLLLMFPRIVFAITNSLMIVFTLVLIVALINCYRPLNKKQAVILFVSAGFLFLTMDALKYIIYWTMGATNYVWTLPLILLFLWYHAKNGLFKHPILQAGYVAITSCFHESILVFFLIFILGHIVYDFYKKEKWNPSYGYYFLALLLAGIFIFASPGNRIRNNTWYPEWNKLNWIERLTMTIPVVAKNMFGIEGIHKLVPMFFTGTLLAMLWMNKKKESKIFFGILLLTYIVAIITNNGWIYLIFSMFLFLFEFYLHEQEKNDLSVASLSFYAIVYSMIITPEYQGGRPNYFMYGYMIFMILYWIQPYLKEKVGILFTIFIFLGFSLFAVREISIYSSIGKVLRNREAQIEKVKKENLKVLEFQAIKKEDRRYHMEPNAPALKEYWAYKYFCTYYNLPKEIEVKLIEK